MSVKSDYKVGYKRPPAGTRFRKGASGNPKGRPKAQPGVDSLFRRELLQRRFATIDGKRVNKIVLELIIVSIIQRALQGDHKAWACVLDFASSSKFFIDEKPRIEPEDLTKLSSAELTKRLFDALNSS